jgi:hypothetical protein
MSEIIGIETEQDKDILIIDSQMLSLLMKCGWAYFLKHIHNLRPKNGVPIIPIEKGDLGHRIFDRYYSLRKEKIAHGLALDEAIEMGREFYPQTHIAIDEAEWIIATCQSNLNHFEYDGITVVSVEKPFMLKAITVARLILFVTFLISLAIFLLTINSAHELTKKQLLITSSLVMLLLMTLILSLLMK